MVSVAPAYAGLPTLFVPANWRTRNSSKAPRRMDMRFPREVLILAIVCRLWTCGCTPNQNPQELKEKTAHATAELKSERQSRCRRSAGRLEPRQAAQCEHRHPGAVSQPAVDRRGSGCGDRGRPYDDPGELVTRRILSQSQVRQDFGPVDGEKTIVARIAGLDGAFRPVALFRTHLQSLDRNPAVRLVVSSHPYRQVVVSETFGVFASGDPPLRSASRTGSE